MHSPLVSVVIPTYNAAVYLPQAIFSLQAQTFQDFEIIIVDDCSEDNTREVIGKFNLPHLRYHQLEKNCGGPSKPRNTGITMARGRYIALLDADDIYTSRRLEAAVRFLDDNPDVGLVFMDQMKFDDETGRELGRFLDGYDKFWSLLRDPRGKNQWAVQSQDAFAALFYESYILPSGVTLPREVFEKVGLFDETIKRGEDRDLWFRVAEKYPLGFIHMVGSLYRLRKSSLCGMGGPQFARNRIRVIQKQLTKRLPRQLETQGHKLISVNYYGLGYYYQTRGNMKLARKNFTMSLHERKNWAALKGIMISLLGNKVVDGLKKVKQKLN